MSHFLVISALAADQPGIVDQLAKAAKENACSIMDSRMTVMGGEFAVLMMVSGEEPAIVKMEAQIQALSEQLNLSCVTRRTELKLATQKLLPYKVEVVALDNLGIVHEIASFFSEQSINIENMDTETYSAPHTGSPMFSLNMIVEIPASITISNLKDQFSDFCDDRNLDGALEPARNTL
tara:strand:- start:213 stop:749 length:537 start_codon:yes stop_codon:yes gene_type:complete